MGNEHERGVTVKPLRWKGPGSYGEFHSLDGLWGYIIRDRARKGVWLTEVGRYFGYPIFRVGTHQNAPARKSRSKVDRLIP